MARAISTLCAALVIGLAVTVAACGSRAPAPETVATASPGLLTVKAQLAPDYKAVAAILTNRDIGDARSRIGGVLQSVLVREGQDVHKGQVLALVIDRQLALQAQAGAATVGAAESTAEHARGDLARYQTLYAKGFVAPAQIEALTAGSRAANAQLRAARAQAGALAAANDEGRVLAPANGRVTRLPIPQGAVVLAGDVVVAISTGARVLRIELPEGDAGALKRGQAISMLAEDDGALVRTATVRQIYPAIANGRVTADLDASNLAGDFVGARVRVLVPTGERKTFVVPGKYMVTRYGVDYVRLVRQGGSLDVPVQRGTPIPMSGMPDGVEVLSGLRDGDQILPVGAGP
jgi:RND family efflux transporter MFP subunit